jgi:hypothetical protein
MDRLSRVLAAGASMLVLGTVVLSSGCRSMRNDVPPGKPYSTNGGGPPFASDPHPNNNSIGLYPNMPAGSQGGASGGLSGATAPGQLGTPAPNSGPYTGPSTSAFGQGGAGANP